MSYFRSWSPICYHLTYVRGLIFEAKGQFDEARQCYENTLSVNPTHLSSLYHLGRVYYQLGFYRLSEQTLKVRRRILNCEVYGKTDSHYTVSKCCFFAI
jgi:tetratricopeptide (TPR) repeat protein